MNTIKLSYKKSDFFDEVYPVLEKFYSEATFLSDFNIGIIKYIAQKIGITTKFIKSSELIGIEGEKDYRLVQICKYLKCDNYLSPKGAASYINRKNKGGEFVLNGINLYYHDYSHPEYKQIHKGFVPYLGIYDLLFNVGFDNALDIIRKGRKDNIKYTDLEL